MSASCMQQSGCRHHMGLLCQASLLQQNPWGCAEHYYLSAAAAPKLTASRATYHHQRLQVRALWLCAKNERVQTGACLPRAQRTPYVRQPAARQQRVHTQWKRLCPTTCSVSAPM